MIKDVERWRSDMFVLHTREPSSVHTTVEHGDQRHKGTQVPLPGCPTEVALEMQPVRNMFKSSGAIY